MQFCTNRDVTLRRAPQRCRANSTGSRRSSKFVSFENWHDAIQSDRRNFLTRKTPRSLRARCCPAAAIGSPTRPMTTPASPNARQFRIRRQVLYYGGADCPRQSILDSTVARNDLPGNFFCAVSRENGRFRVRDRRNLTCSRRAKRSSGRRFQCPGCKVAAILETHFRRSSRRQIATLAGIRTATGSSVGMPPVTHFVSAIVRQKPDRRVS